jgi:hypothetical protein
MSILSSNLVLEGTLTGYDNAGWDKLNFEENHRAKRNDIADECYEDALAVLRRRISNASSIEWRSSWSPFIDAFDPNEQSIAGFQVRLSAEIANPASFSQFDTNVVQWNRHEWHVRFYPFGADRRSRGHTLSARTESLWATAGTGNAYCAWAKIWWMATQVNSTVLRLDLDLMSRPADRSRKGSNKCRQNWPPWTDTMASQKTLWPEYLLAPKILEKRRSQTVEYKGRLSILSSV